MIVITFIEAMSFGLATICFSDIPNEDIINDQKDGLVVQERTPDALAEAISRLIENEVIRDSLGEKAAVSVKRFNKEHIAKQVLAFMKL